MSVFSILSKEEKKQCEQILAGVDSNSFESIPDQLFSKLYDYYVSNGEMPYSVQKARDTDPQSWIVEKIEEEFQKLH